MSERFKGDEYHPVTPDIEGRLDVRLPEAGGERLALSGRQPSGLWERVQQGVHHFVAGWNESIDFPHGPLPPNGVWISGMDLARHMFENYYSESKRPDLPNKPEDKPRP